MKHKVFFCILLIMSLMLAECGIADTESQSSETSDTKTEVSMKNIVLGKVPDGYYSAAPQQGKLENFTYDTKDYIGSGNAIQSSATVYLPYGYDQDDSTARYNILYLQHGAYGNERTWMYEYGDSFKNMIDHMIEDKLIPPLIIVMPSRCRCNVSSFSGMLLSGRRWQLCERF